MPKRSPYKRETIVVGMYLETQTPYVMNVQQVKRALFLFMVLRTKFIPLTTVGKTMGARSKLGWGSRSDTALDEYRNTFWIVWQAIKLSD